jgi:membrane protease YdiL (CAAX protease family)
MNNRSFWNFELGSAGCLAPGKTLAIRCLAWAAALYAITFGFLFASVFAPQWLNLPSSADYVPALLVPIIGFGFYALLVRVGEKRRPTEIVFKPSSLIELAVGVVVGFAIMVVILALVYAMGFYRVQIGHWSGWFNSLVFDSYISGMLEELAFRAILLRLFARMFNPVAGLVISSALFGVAHLTHGTPFQALEIAFNAGLTMGIPYMITGRLWMSVGMHIGWDFTEESLLGVNTTHGFLLSTPDPTHSVLLTGGAYGPDGSLFAALVGALFVVGMLYSNKRGWFPFRGNP